MHRSQILSRGRRNGSTPVGRLSLAFPGGPQAAGEARAALSALQRDLGPAMLATIRLLITELVNNSVAHGGAGPEDQIRVDLTASAVAIYAEVADLGPGFDPDRSEQPGDGTSLHVGGWGLVLVDQLSSHWGTSRGGRTVWFELERHEQDSSVENDHTAADADQALSDTDQTSAIRRRAAPDREQSAQTRLSAADARDAVAIARDLAALARDAAAAAREKALEQLDAAESAGEHRALAAEHRAMANRDRTAAARDRERAREERRHALADRKAFAKALATAETDPLTGARMRAAGLLDLNHEVDRSHRNGEPLIAAYVDVVGLKALNDSKGHGAGDALLQRVVTLLRKHLRSYDLVVRLGGDEFLCAMSNMTLPDARRRFRALTEALAAGPQTAEITTGLAELTPDDTATDLIARADNQLIEARRCRPQSAGTIRHA